MMHEEFEKIAGYEVRYEDYKNIIEPMYMALPNVSKQEFVKMIDKKRFALPTQKQMLREIRAIAEHLYDICGHSTDHEAEEDLLKKLREYAKRVYGIDWANDIKVYAYTVREYEFPELQRGCTYPKTAIIGYGDRELERIDLVK